MVIFALVIGICIAAESRAQIIGAFLLLSGWAFFAYGRRVPWGKRFGALGIASIGLLASYPVLQRRFEEDPSGGSRGILQEIGLNAVMDHPLVGVGPNSYVSVVGLSDALTASGVPVHNAFLLAAVELGIAGAVALWLPVLWTFARGFRLRKELGIVQAPAATAAAFLAPFTLSAFTGWGLLADPLWALLMLAMGAIYALMSPLGADEEVLKPVLQHRGRS
jgi:O-antigen ligase